MELTFDPQGLGLNRVNASQKVFINQHLTIEIPHQSSTRNFIAKIVSWQPTEPEMGYHASGLKVSDFKVEHSFVSQLSSDHGHFQSHLQFGGQVFEHFGIFVGEPLVPSQVCNLKLASVRVTN